MKKTIAILLAAVMLLSFVACGGASKEDLIGTWEVTSADVGEDGDLMVGSTMTFDENDQFEWSLMGFTVMSGSYEVKGRYLVLDGENTLFSIDGDTLKIKDASGEMTLTRK